MMFGYGYSQFGWIGMLISTIIWLLVIGGIVWFVVWAVRRSNSVGSQSNYSAGPSAKEIVQQRYARGEINRDQYQELLEDLNR